MEKVLILDFGSQLSQLIARRVRELNIYCEIHPFDIAFEEIKNINPKGIILTGSPNSVNSGEYIADKEIFNLGIPIFGICYGMQWMVHSLGGKVEIANKREYGSAIVYTKKSSLTDGIYDEINPYALKVWMSHGDKVVSLPNNFKIIGFNENCPFAMIADEKRKFYGVQFHPEVTHTINGTKLLSRFLFDICKLKSSWTMPNYVDTAINNIKEKVGNDNVVLGLSGGVDSTVAATLIHKAINKQLFCIFVDHGLLRKNEAREVLATYREYLGLNIIYIDAKDRFIKKLAKITDPEEKRKIIGKEFVEVFQEEAKKLDSIKWLAQGTIYPDVIESASDKNKKAHAIKSHHNVGGLPETLHLKLLEPLRNLFKDEVRKLGLTLGLPKEMLFRHPFPGPGLAVRILGEITPYYIKLLQDADAILIEELYKSTNDKGEKWYYLVSQAFVVFLPIKSVGVMGDGRSYDYVVSLRIVVTEDFMTANWARLPYDLLEKISSRIINEVKGINRVVYDISSKPPATVEWE